LLITIEGNFLGFQEAFGVITKLLSSNKIGHHKELLYQVEPILVDTIIQSHSIENFCFFQISIFNLAILPFFDLKSNSFTANSFLFFVFIFKIEYS
jgi:hypothetical protein